MTVSKATIISMAFATTWAGHEVWALNGRAIYRAKKKEREVKCCESSRKVEDAQSLGAFCPRRP